MRKNLVLILTLSVTTFFFVQASLQPKRNDASHLVVGSNYRGFVVTKAVDVAEWQAKVIELEHEATGSQILHVQTDDPENFFCLSFRTAASTSNGVAHVLEHSVFQGSNKYPVKNVFHSMNRRSLATFMNAFTGLDYTCYPAASQSEEDFYNLLSVYLDAAFHPLLEPRSFAQEGHRLEFSESSNPASALVYKGVVYNEMKGKLSSPQIRLMKTIYPELLPDTSARVFSGGDPKEIPNLRYEEFVSFHQEHYYPGNCLFFFYGNLPLEKHLDFLLEHELNDWKRKAPVTEASIQPRFSEKRYVEHYYPVSEKESDAADAALIGCTWLTCKTSDVQEVLALKVIDQILMGSDASPLRHELMSTGLCKDAESNFDATKAEAAYLIYLEGCSAECADRLEAKILLSLEQIVQQGISQEMIDRAIGKLELANSELRKGLDPIGLALWFQCALLKQHGGQAEEGLRTHSHLHALRQKIENEPSYLSDLILKHFVHNPHFVRVVMKPSKALAKEEFAEEQQRLAEIKKALSDEERAILIQQAQELRRDQDTGELRAVELLPKISIEHVSKEIPRFDLSRHSLGNIELFHHQAFTNQLTYADLIFDLPEIAEEDLWLVRLFTVLLPQVGAADRSYTENLKVIHDTSGGIDVALSCYHPADGSSKIRPSLHIAATALDRKAEALFSLLFDTSARPNFSEKERIKQLIIKHASDLQFAIKQHALEFAVKRSLVATSAANRLADSWNGFEYIYKVQNLVDHFDQEQDLLFAKLNVLKDCLLCTGGAKLVVTCDKTVFQQQMDSGFGGLDTLPTKTISAWKSSLSLPKPKHQGVEIASPVAFNAMGFSSIAYNHPDCAYVRLAADLFTNKVLYKRVREQGGAYSTGANFDVSSGNFCFYSYRDPNIATTLQAFQEAIDLIGEGQIEEKDLQEAKVCVLQRLDAPIPPASRGLLAYQLLAEGKTDEMRKAFREKILNASSVDIQKAVLAHIAPGFRQSVLVSIASRELIERENQKLPFQLMIEKKETRDFDPTIPVIDMQDLYSNVADRRRAFIQGLRTALKDVGFVAVVNPGVDTKTLDDAYLAAQAFFDLSKEEKMRFFDLSNNGQRGFIPGETAKGAGKKDLKEFFHMGRELSDEQQARLQFAKNIWPDNPEFKKALQALYTALEAYIIPLQEAMAEAIDQPKDLFTKMTQEGDVMLRAIRYFRDQPPRANLAGEHTDIDLFALLPRATAEGLQVKNRAGDWIDVRVPDNAFIINAGDMLENMTNGEFTSAWHRVVAPRENIDRYSMVLFVHPRHDDQIGPLAKSIERTEGQMRYADGTRQEFLAERLIDLGLASDDMIKNYAASGHTERQLLVGRASVKAMQKLREMNLASESVLQELNLRHKREP